MAVSVFHDLASAQRCRMFLGLVRGAPRSQSRAQMPLRPAVLPTPVVPSPTSARYGVESDALSSG
eukprot:4710639-Pyramimonas_sp.AAC.1